MGMKPRNKVLNKRHFNIRGLQILTGRFSVRVNDVPAGIYFVNHDGDNVDKYAKGKRVAVKFYLDENIRFVSQKNPNLRELTFWLKPEEFKKMQSLSVQDEVVQDEDTEIDWEIPDYLL